MVLVIKRYRHRTVCSGQSCFSCRSVSSHLVCVSVCVHCFYAPWSAVRTNNLLHWLLSCFSHYHPLSCHLCSPAFSRFLSFLPNPSLPPPSCLSESLFSKNIPSESAPQKTPPMRAPSLSLLFVHLLLLHTVYFFCLRSHTSTNFLPLSRLGRKQCTGTGVRGVV